MSEFEFEFEYWIEQVESSEILGRGLLTASLEHRGALRLAFEAGQAAVYVKLLKKYGNKEGGSE